MAKTRSGGIVGQVSGSIGGNTFAPGPAGSVVRTRRIPTRRRTAPASAARSALATYSGSWRSLPAASRAAWETFATNTPIPNSFGDPITLSGHQAFTRLNSRLARVAADMIFLPPTAAPPAGFTSFSASWDPDARALSVSLSGPAGSHLRYVFEAVLTHSAGISAARGHEKIAAITTPADRHGYRITNGLSTTFGSLKDGQHLLLFGHVLDATTGLISGRGFTSAAIGPANDSPAALKTTFATDSSGTFPIAEGDPVVFLSGSQVGLSPTAESVILGRAAHDVTTAGNPLTVTLQGIFTWPYEGAAPDFTRNALSTGSTPGTVAKDEFGAGRGLTLAVDTAASTVTVLFHQF